MDLSTSAAIEGERRSVAMMQPGGPGLDREASLEVLAELQRLRTALEQLQR